MLRRLTFGILAICATVACTSSEQITIEDPTPDTIRPTTSTAAPKPIAPAGLADEVSISLIVDALNIDQRVTMLNDGPVGVISPVASCSLVEGGSWFPLEVVVSDELFIRISSTTPTPNGIGAIDGSLTYQDQRNAPLDVPVTIYVSDDSSSGSFTGRDAEGREVSGEFDCSSAVAVDETPPQGNTELSLRLRTSNDMGGQRVRRLGMRASTTQQCPSSIAEPANRWKVENADHPVGGLESAVLKFDSSSGNWSGEFEIADDTVVVENLAVSMMPNGLVFSGVSVDNLSVDGALAC